MGRGVKTEVAIQTNFMAFLSLWKVKKYREALAYIKLCTQAINSMNRHHSGSFSSKTRLNLVGIIAMSLSACIVQIEGDSSRGIEIMEQCMQQLSDLDVEAKPLMSHFIDRLSTFVKTTDESLASSFGGFGEGLATPDYSLPSLPSEYFERKAANAAGHPYIKDHFDDLLVTKEFESIFFITNFLAHIDHSTPLIRESELEMAEARQHSTFIPKNILRSKASKQFLPKHEELPVVHNRSYLKLFRNIVDKSRVKMGVLEGVGAYSQRGDARTDSNRPHARSESEMENQARTKSVPIRKRVGYPSPTPRSHRLSPSLSILKDLQRRNQSLQRARHNVESMQQEALSRRRTKQNIMVEFTPETYGAAEIGVNLQPLSFASLASPESALNRFLRMPVGKLKRDEAEYESL